MKTVALIQARLSSTRLPGKVLRELAGMPVLEWVVRAARATPGVDEVVVATSDDAGEDPIAAWCAEAGIACFRGDKEDVLKRMAEAAALHRADIVIRFTADCPFLDPHVCAQVLCLLQRQQLDYATNTHPNTWPDGLDCEVMTGAALARAAAEAVLPSHREHVTPYIRNNRALFRQAVARCPIPGLSGERWTLDTAEDFAFLGQIAPLLPAGRAPSFTEVLAVRARRPDLKIANVAATADRSVTKSFGPDLDSPHFSKRSYARSSALLQRSEKTIPLGTQTFSKSKLLFPPGKAPLFLSHGLGARVWDVDGNLYVDHICALLPVLLGYCDPDVDAAIEAQLSRGISFSLATELEAELAERLVRIVPCAEMVRFGKNGTDATSAAIRIARAFTGRDRVAVCGYHGWQDWYIGSTTRHLGVPGAVRELTHTFPYNNIAALEELLSRHKGEFAAVMMEPATFSEPPKGYLEAVKELAHRHGALLIFDEVVSGMRFALGGAQELFGVTPDLAAFGKAMGNGMPISACVGRAEVMAKMEDVFLSGTFGGEALSLAAAIATIDKAERLNVIPAIWSYGERLATEVTRKIEANGLSKVLRLTGFEPWKQLAITPPAGANAYAIRTFLMRRLHDNGVLMTSTHNICYAHNDITMLMTLAAYEKTLPQLAEALAAGDLEAHLDCAAMQPIFAVRA